MAAHFETSGFPVDRDEERCLDAVETLADEADACDGLRAHIAALEEERDRIEQRIRSVRHTLEALQAGVEPRMDVMLAGFNDRCKDEVISRWGERAFQVSNDWWHGKTLDQQQAWKWNAEDLVAFWVAAARSGVSPTSERAQSLAARYVEWLSGLPDTLTAEGDRECSIEMVKGLGTCTSTPRGRSSSATRCKRTRGPGCSSGAQAAESVDFCTRILREPIPSPVGSFNLLCKGIGS